MNVQCTYMLLYEIADCNSIIIPSTLYANDCVVLKNYTNMVTKLEVFNSF